MQAGGVAGAFEYSCVCWREVSASATNNLYSPVSNATTLLLYTTTTITTTTTTTIHVTSCPNNQIHMCGAPAELLHEWNDFYVSFSIHSQGVLLSLGYPLHCEDETSLILLFLSISKQL